MPTYDYRCNACDHEFELFQSMSDSVKRKCPECGKLKLERLIGIGAAVIFKGSGFYETDYRSEGYKKDAKAAKDAAKPTKTSSNSDSKSESKQSKDSTGSKSADTGSPKQAVKPSKPEKKG